MSTQEWNEAQIKAAKDNAQSTENRYKYFITYGERHPTVKELEAFYLKDNATDFARKHKR